MMGKVYGLTTTRVYNVIEKYRFVKGTFTRKIFFSSQFPHFCAFLS